MANATRTPVAATVDVFDDASIAAAGFLARYSGNTRTAYTTDLRIWFQWCQDHQLQVLDARRPHIELFGRWLEEERRNVPASVHRRLSTVRCFYRFAAIDGYLPASPAEYIRMPRVISDDSRRLGLDRLELSAFVATARALGPTEWALAVLLGLLGLRVSEACGVKITDFADTERGHRVLRLVGKGGKPATIPLPVPVLRGLEACAGTRAGGQLLLTRIGTPMTRHAATRAVCRVAKKAGITKPLSPHSLRHSMVTNALDAGVPLRDVQIAARHSDPRITMRYDRARQNLDRHAVHILSAYVAGSG